MTMMTTLETMATRAGVAVDRLIDSHGAEGEYRRLVGLAATGEHVQPDADLLEAVNRFPADFAADVKRRQQRDQAAAEIAAAEAELARLGETAAPRPSSTSPLDGFENLGQLAIALELLRRPNASSPAEVEQRQARQAAEQRRAAALNLLRFTSDKTIDDLDAIQRARIEAARQRIDQRHTAWSRRQAIQRELAKPDPGHNVKTERERRTELERECRRLGKVAATADAVTLADAADRAEVQQAEAEIIRIDKQRLVPERMAWSAARG